MTYKNTKFDESPVMRSLEKLAVKKGLVKPETISKTAAKKSSLEPGENLEENILKLCSALRSSGHERHADEVENKFFNLKRAQASYSVHTMTGEDEINTAHPEGSHQMKNVDGDAMVETVIDIQKAIQNMIAKKPTGKQAHRKLADLIKEAGKLEKMDAVNAVKVLLAQSQNNESDAKAYFLNLVNHATGLVNSILQTEDLSDITFHDSMDGGQEATTGLTLKTTKGHLENILENLNAVAKMPVGRDSMMQLNANLNAFMTLVQKASNLTGGIKTQYIAAARDLFSKSEKIVSILRGEQPTTPSNVHVLPEVEVRGLPAVFRNIQTKIDQDIAKLNSWKAVIDTYDKPGDVKAGNGFIASLLTKLHSIIEALHKVDPSQADALAPNLTTMLTGLETKMQQFYAGWIQ